MPNPTDEHWMQRALTLAEEAVGLASPNPTVGCVLVRDGEFIAGGAHHYETRDHAEIVALKQAGDRARGATAYVTLEPCSHHGRTGPCADALLRAGVARVVAATVDPNPQVSGQGLARLCAARVECVSGVAAQAAQRLNRPFARHIRSGLPFVTLKAGVSLDGRIAPPDHPSGTVYLTSSASLATVQTMRHASDALLTGIGTVLADDPLLTDRSKRARRRPLLRVVLDSELRFPTTARLLTECPESVLILTNRASSREAEALRQHGAQVEPAPLAPNGRMDLGAVLQLLGSRGVLSVLTEAGSQLNRALLNGNHVDQLGLFYAPIVLGSQGVPLFSGGASLRLTPVTEHVELSGGDLHADLLLRDPWAAA